MCKCQDQQPWDNSMTCAECLAFFQPEHPVPPDAGECRAEPPTPISAYDAAYPSIRGSRGCCMQFQLAPTIELEESPNFMSGAQGTKPDTVIPDEVPDESDSTTVPTLKEEKEDFVMDHDMSSIVDDKILSGMHPKRSGVSKNRPKVECETCLAIWDFNEAHGFISE